MRTRLQEWNATGIRHTGLSAVRLVPNAKKSKLWRGNRTNIYIYIYLFAYMYMLALYASKSGVGAGTDYLYTYIESYRCAWRCWLDQGESSPCFLLVPTRICIQIIYSIYIYIYLQVYIYIYIYMYIVLYISIYFLSQKDCKSFQEQRNMDNWKKSNKTSLLNTCFHLSNGPSFPLTPQPQQFNRLLSA